MVRNKGVARGAVGGGLHPPIACHCPLTLRGRGGKDPKLMKKRGKHEKNDERIIKNDVKT